MNRARTRTASAYRRRNGTGLWLLESWRKSSGNIFPKGKWYLSKEEYRRVPGKIRKETNAIPPRSSLQTCACWSQKERGELMKCRATTQCRLLLRANLRPKMTSPSKGNLLPAPSKQVPLKKPSLLGFNL